MTYQDEIIADIQKALLAAKRAFEEDFAKYHWDITIKLNISAYYMNNEGDYLISKCSLEEQQ